MRRFLPFLILLCTISAHAQISVVEIKGNHVNSACNTTGDTVSLGINTTATEIIIIGWQNGTGGTANPTITDSGSQTYTIATNTTSLNSHHDAGIAYVANSASGISSVKITTASDAVCHLVVLHAKGIATSSPVDVTNAISSTNQGTPWASASGTTTTANELLVGMTFTAAVSVACTDSASAPWTGQDAASGGDINGDDSILLYQIVSATGTYSTAGTTSGTGCKNYPGMVTFKGSGGGGGSTPGFNKQHRLELLEARK